MATSVTCVEDSEGVLAAIAGSDVLDGGENPVASVFVRRRSGQLLRCSFGRDFGGAPKCGLELEAECDVGSGPAGES